MKKSYCDAWFEACKNDCYSEESFEPEETKELNKVGISLGLIGTLAFILCVMFSGFLVHRERSGKPVFVADTQVSPGEGDVDVRI